MIGAFLLALLAAGTAPAIDVRALERGRVLAAADAFLREPPVTVTATSSPRSSGGRHDFFSEGDYWWPDPANPAGPYVRRDGQSNPDNFVGHRQALVRLSRIVPALAAAWVLTGEARYSEHAARHLRAWFVDEETRMAPHLRYAQAIHGVSPGRGVGIIDTIHLVEVARAIEVLERAPGLSPAERDGRRALVRRLPPVDDHRPATASRRGRRRTTTAPAGWCRWPRSRGSPGTRSSWPGAASASRPSWCRARWPPTAASRSRRPARSPTGTRSSTSRRWPPPPSSSRRRATTSGASRRADGRGLRRAVAWLVPFIRDRKGWPFPPDVMYDDQWPMRQASLLFAGLAFGEPSYLELWKTLPADSDGGRGRPELLHPPAGALGLAVIPRSPQPRRATRDPRTRRRIPVTFSPTPSSFSRSEAPSTSSSIHSR